MSEPLTREQLEDALAAQLVSEHDFDDVCSTALHYLDRVAELEKERDEAQKDRDDMDGYNDELNELLTRAEAGLAAAQEALKKYGRHLGPCAARRGSTRAGELGNRLPCDCGLADALARGGGQQETEG